MPEYLAPGVYVEEVSFRAKSIEGVSTSVTGFVGPTRTGPVGGETELLTSFADFERIYGGLDSLVFESGSESETQLNFMAHAVRACFDNEGSKLYVTRSYDARNLADPDSGKASQPVGAVSPPLITLRARFPGRAGNMRITFAVKTSPNLLTVLEGVPQARGLREHDVVFITNGPPLSPSLEDFYAVVRSGDELVFDSEAAGQARLSDLTPAGSYRIHLVAFSVRVLRPGLFDVEEQLGDFSLHPRSRNALTAYFTEDPGSRRRFLSVPFQIETSLTSGARLADALLSSSVRDALLRSLATDDELAAFSPDLERPRLTELEQVYTLGRGRGAVVGGDGRLPTAN